VALIGNGGIEGFHVKCAVGLELALAHLVEVLEALLVDDEKQLVGGQRLAFHDLAVELGIEDEDGGPALQHARQPL
jgi:hypothetical protein